MSNRKPKTKNYLNKRHFFISHIKLIFWQRLLSSSSLPNKTYGFHLMIKVANYITSAFHRVGKRKERKRGKVLCYLSLKRFLSSFHIKLFFSKHEYSQAYLQGGWSRGFWQKIWSIKFLIVRFSLKIMLK